jgi:hypothetical protein
MKFDGPFGRAQYTCNGIQQGGLACSIGTDDGDDQRFPHLKGYIPEGVEVAVIGIDVLNSEKRDTSYSSSIPR